MARNEELLKMIQALEKRVSALEKRPIANLRLGGTLGDVISRTPLPNSTFPLKKPDIQGKIRK